MTRKLLPLLLLALSAPAWGAYAYRATITVPYKCVGGGNCTSTSGTEAESNFTVPVSGSDTSLKLHSGGGQIYNTTTEYGEIVPVDLIFTTDATCASVAGVNGWAFKYYSGTSGLFYAYVGVGTLSYTANTVLYACYGQSSANTWLGGSAGAAFNSAAAYFPLGNGTTLNDSDFSANANPVSYLPSLIVAMAGGFDGAVSVPGSNGNGIQYSPSTGLPSGAINATMCMVAYNSAIFSLGEYFAGVNFGPYQTANTLTLNWGVSSSNNGGAWGINAVGSVPSNTWVPLCVTIASGTTVRFYINGAADSGNPQTISALGVTGDRMDVGQDAQWSAVYATQSSDNLIYGSVKSAGWIATWSNSMSQNSTFAAVSAIGPLSGGAATVTMTPIIM